MIASDTSVIEEGRKKFYVSMVCFVLRIHVHLQMVQIKFIFR